MVTKPASLVKTQKMTSEDRVLNFFPGPSALPVEVSFTDLLSACIKTFGMLIFVIFVCETLLG